MYTLTCACTFVPARSMCACTLVIQLHAHQDGAVDYPDKIQNLLIHFK